MKMDNPLIAGELCFEKGEINKAKVFFSSVLKTTDISSSEEIIAKIGLIKVENLLGNHENVKSIMGSLDLSTFNRMQIAYVDMCQGWLLINKESKKGVSLLQRSSRVFKESGFTLLEGKCEAYLGIHYFYQNMIPQAKYHLEKAYKLSTEGGHEYLKNYVRLNLQDVHLKEGNIKKAEQMLSSAERYFQNLKVDMYGLACCKFNRALIQLEQGKIEEAYMSLSDALNVAYPLPNNDLRRIWKTVFNERSREKGYPHRFPIDV